MPTAIRRLATAIPVVILLAACGEAPASAPSEPAASIPTASEVAEPSDAPSVEASEIAASVPASQSVEPEPGLAIPLEAPCHAIDKAVVAQLIGGAINETREWVPGDQPFGDRVPPSGNFGCQYVGELPEGNAPANEFGLSIVGRELTAEDWKLFTDRFGACTELDVESEIAGLIATACEGAPGYTNVGLHGLLGSTGLSCTVYRPEGEVNAALESAVLDECVRVILELAGTAG